MSYSISTLIKRASKIGSLDVSFVTKWTKPYSYHHFISCISRIAYCQLISVSYMIDSVVGDSWTGAMSNICSLCIGYQNICQISTCSSSLIIDYCSDAFQLNTIRQREVRLLISDQWIFVSIIFSLINYFLPRIISWFMLLIDAIHVFMPSPKYRISSRSCWVAHCTIAIKRRTVLRYCNMTITMIIVI